MEHTARGIHTALSKYPLGDEDRFINSLRGQYRHYRNNIISYLQQNTKAGPAADQRFEHLYKPAVFHVYSHFDVAFISLVDNFKFSQRVFEPMNLNPSDEKIKSVSYQILSGAVLKSKCKITPNHILQARSGRLLPSIQNHN